MIVYENTKAKYLNDVRESSIEEIIHSAIQNRLGINVGQNEIRSWQNSLKEMYFILEDKDIPENSRVAIEYRIPQTSKRLDFVITGENEKKQEEVIIVELKQWDKVERTEKDAIVKTRFQQGESEHEHPSYQAWSYAMLLKNFNETVYTENIQISPCAYLHNYTRDGVIDNNFYTDYINKAPIFLKNEKDTFKHFIKTRIRYADQKHTLKRIEYGKIKPSKSLADSLKSMLKGNQEFIMIDDQKLVYETALELSKKANIGNKKVLIVQGGPGTGKSVVAINLLVELTRRGQVTKYVTKNSAPRTVYESMLTGDFKKSQISELFSGSGSFTETHSNYYDALIVDEAHRLNRKSGMFKNKGENQIKEIINSSRLSIFFIDEEQKVTWEDIGDIEEIQKWSKFYNAEVVKVSLSSQFRCNGSDGYIAWLDHVLQIRETANYNLLENDFEFKIIDSAQELRERINEKNKERNKARIVAGYCWNWISKKNKDTYDITIPTEPDFNMKWNLTTDGNLWILKPESVSEAGCIHTCQGLELDYVGVIVGLDLIVRDNKVITVPTSRAKTDTSLNGFKKLAETDKIKAYEKADLIIKNTYRTLMTRGMKGCYVYFTDKETQEYFKKVTSKQ